MVIPICSLNRINSEVVLFVYDYWSVAASSDLHGRVAQEEEEEAYDNMEPVVQMTIGDAPMQSFSKRQTERSRPNDWSEDDLSDSTSLLDITTPRGPVFVSVVFSLIYHVYHGKNDGIVIMKIIVRFSAIVLFHREHSLRRTLIFWKG